MRLYVDCMMRPQKALCPPHNQAAVIAQALGYFNYIQLSRVREFEPGSLPSQSLRHFYPYHYSTHYFQFFTYKIYLLLLHFCLFYAIKCFYSHSFTIFIFLFCILTVIFMSLQFDRYKFLDQIADSIGGYNQGF